MKNLEQMLSKKKEGEMSQDEIQAKMDVLQELMDMCKEKMGSSVKDGMDEMQKVTVAAPDKESLALGLEKAQEIAESSPIEELEEKAEEADESESEHVNPYDSRDEEDEDSMFAKRK